jgi:YVTN family beta-propeller protein
MNRFPRIDWLRPGRFLLLFVTAVRAVVLLARGALGASGTDVVPAVGCVPTARRKRVAVSLAAALSLLAGTLLALAPAASAASSGYAVTEIYTSGGPTYGVAGDPATNTIYAGAYTSLDVIDGTSNTITAQIDLGWPVQSVAVDATTDTVYALAEGGRTFVINGTTNTVTATVDVPCGVFGSAAVNPVTDMVYVTDCENGTVTVIDGNTNTVTATIPVVLGSTTLMYGVAVDPTTDTIYVADAEDDEVAVIDGATNAVTGRIALPARSDPIGVAVDPASGLVYTADYDTNSVSAIDPATDSVSTLATGLTGPYGLALDSGSGTLYVGSISGSTASLSDLGTTYVIDTATGAIEDQFPRGGECVAVAVSGGPAYVDGPADYPPNSNAVTVLTPSSMNTMSPIIVGDTTFTFSVGQPAQDQLTASATPAASFSALTSSVPSENLPAGLTLSPAGLLSGTPAAGTAGLYVVGVTASNGVAPSYTTAIDVTVDGAPSITSPDQATFYTGVASSTFTVTASGYPEPTFSETGTLPSGVTLTSTGVLSGAPAVGTAGVYPIQLTATNSVGAATQAFTLTVSNGSSYVPVGPVRVLDTRNGTGGYDAPVGPGATISLQVTGVDGVPTTGVTAVVLNVTATEQTASSYVTVYPAGETRPTASNLNFTAGETIPNLVTVPVGADGDVDFYNNAGSTDLVADLEGYYTTGSGSLFDSVGPVRVLDTRDGTGGYTTPVGPGQTISLQMAGTDGVPATGATAVVLNVTATEPTTSSYVTVYPDGETRPTASNLNFTAGETIANLVTVPVGADGDIDFYNNSGSTDLVADLAGYYTSSGTGSSYVPLGPVRVLDTRNGTGGYDAPVGPGGTISLQLTGADGVPATGVTAVVLNVTATDPTASSYVTVYPDGETRPTASNLNFTAGQTIPNLVIVPVGADGDIDFYNNTGSTDLVADLAGYFIT